MDGYPHVTAHTAEMGGQRTATANKPLPLFVPAGRRVCDYQNFPTHPHYHGPGMTYFLWRYIQHGLMEPSTYFTQGAL